MKRRGAGAQPNTKQRRERTSKCLRERCDLAKPPDLRVSHDRYLKPNLGCVLQRQRTGSDSMRRGIPWQFHEET